jgi:hypothetical protein
MKIWKFQDEENEENRLVIKGKERVSKHERGKI